MRGHRCPACGSSHPATILLSERVDADDAAERSLSTQADAARARGAYGLERALRRQRQLMHRENAARRRVMTGLGPLYERIAQALRENAGKPGEAAAIRRAVEAKNLTWVAGLIHLAGGDPLLTSYADDFGALVADSLAQAIAGGLPVENMAPDVLAARVGLMERQTEALREVFIIPTAEALFDGLASTFAAESLTDRIERTAARLQDTLGRAATIARTEIAEFDRTLTVVTGEAFGATHYLYTGPSDGITRPFCEVVLGVDGSGMVWPVELIARLDNAQTATSPIVSGGGYNCRHGWTPVSEGAAVDMGVPFADDSHVREANDAAARGRRR